VSFLSDEQSNELRAIFFESAQELMQTLNDDGLSLEKDPANTETTRSIRRTVHTLKGDSAACGYRELSELAHALEDVLTAEMAAKAGKKMANVVLNAADAFDGMLTAYKNNLLPPDSSAIREMITALANCEAEEEQKFAPEFAWNEYERLLIDQQNVRGKKVYNIGMRFDPNCLRTAAMQLLRNAFQELGSLVAIHPSGEVTEVPDVIEVAIASHHEISWIEKKCKIPAVVEEIVVERIPSPDDATSHAPSVENTAETAPNPVAPETAFEAAAPVVEAAPEKHFVAQQQLIDPSAFTAPKLPDLPLTGHTPAPQPQTPPPQTGPAVDNILRVDAERVDLVLDLVGELIIGKSMFRDALEEFNRLHPKDPLRGKLSDALAFQSQVLNKLQRSVMKIRMVPVEQLFRRFPRNVRDLALVSGKDVRLEISGENTDLDKGILDALSEPLTHLLRNAVDHGIESKEEREKAGKPAQGVVTLDAYHQGNQVVIEVRDDGVGIERDKVVKKAFEKGLITREEIERLSDNDAFNLIFHPGLSTSAQVTEISGRGVGMDIVKSVMDRLKGSIHIQSEPGKGSTFQLRLPLTLAIIKALLFRVRNRLYAVPIGAVQEINRAQESEIHIVDKHEVIKLRDELLTLVRLRRMMPAEANEPPATHKGKIFIVVVAVGHRKFGLVVDRLAGEQELVIKALDEKIMVTNLVSGASVLGDGRVVLILNLNNAVERLGRSAFQEVAHHKDVVEQEAL